MRLLLAIAAALVSGLAVGQAGVRSSSSGTNTATTSHTITLPATISPDDTIEVFFCFDNGNGGNEPGWPGAWTSRTVENHGTVMLDSAWLKAVGNEDGTTISVTTTNSDVSSFYAVALQNAEDPDTQAPEWATNSAATADAIPTFSTLTPTGGSKAYLWFTIVCAEDQGVDTFSSGYGNTGQIGDDVPSNIAWGRRTATASSETPGNAALNAIDQWSSATYAVHPGASSALLIRRRLDE